MNLRHLRKSTTDIAVYLVIFSFVIIAMIFSIYKRHEIAFSLQSQNNEDVINSQLTAFEASVDTLLAKAKNDTEPLLKELTLRLALAQTQALNAHLDIELAENGPLRKLIAMKKTLNRILDKIKQETEPQKTK